MSAHAKLSASAAHRWMLCPGSIRESRGLKNEGSLNAAEGTFAHEIAALALNNIQPPERSLGKRRIVDDKFEVECTQEMVEAVQSYVADIHDETLPGDQLWVERDLTPALAKVHPALGGTADCIRYRPSHKHLRVRDFKYGAGVLVEVEENKQAMVYALGALLETGVPCDSVTATIDQPRAEHPDGRVRDYTFPASRLLDFAAELVDAAAATEAPDAPLIPGEKQCKWCLAKPHCPALAAKQQAMMVNDFAAPNLPALTGERLSEALTVIPLVKARIKALEEEAYTRATRGDKVPGFKLVEKRATRQWKDEAEVVTWAEQNAIDPYEKSVLSPAGLEKRIAANAPKGEKKKAGQVIEPFVVKVSSGMALVPEADDRAEAKRLDDKDFAAPATPAQVQDQVVNLF